jgi:hypothetical protein
VLPNQEEDVVPLISVHAMTGNSSFKTMRVTCYFRKKPLNILIAKKIGCIIDGISCLKVSIVRRQETCIKKGYFS